MTPPFATMGISKIKGRRFYFRDSGVKGVGFDQNQQESCIKYCQLFLVTNLGREFSSVTGIKVTHRRWLLTLNKFCKFIMNMVKFHQNHWNQVKWQSSLVTEFSKKTKGILQKQFKFLLLLNITVGMLFCLVPVNQCKRKNMFWKVSYCCILL